MNSMLDDIEKYAKIWDTALEKDIFKDAPKPPQPRVYGDEDFFGQYRPVEDMDAPLNEVDSKYWAKVSKLAGHYGEYIDPLALCENKKSDVKNTTEKMAAAHNPVHPTSVGKDQDMDVTQNWAVGGKEHFQLEELKVRLEKLESKLNGMEAQEQSGKDTQNKIDGLKKQIDDLSDFLGGTRFDVDG